MNKKIQKLIEKAKIDFLAKKEKKHRLICFVLDSKYRIISIGHNSYSKTHTLQSKLAAKCGNKNREYLHAEISALARIIRNMAVNPVESVAKILIVRFNKKGELTLASPCQICRQAIKMAGIKEVIYTTNSGIDTEFGV